VIEEQKLHLVHTVRRSDHVNCEKGRALSQRSENFGRIRRYIFHRWEILAARLRTWLLAPKLNFAAV
jgi:hypothetical protein